MSTFTYEENNLSTSLETFEWDNTWIDHTADNTSPRILYIGDSISCGTRRVATLATGEKILFDGFGTSKALDNPFLKESVKLFAAQQPRRDAIIINNGLHGWHLDDKTEYKKYYKDFIEFLLNEFEGTPIFIVLTTNVVSKTYIPEGRESREERVTNRNAVASDLAKEYGLKVIDLYTLSANNPELLCGDGVHFTPEGYSKLANTIISTLCEELNITY